MALVYIDYWKNSSYTCFFLEPACDGQHGYQVPSVNSGFIDILIREQMLNIQISICEQHKTDIYLPECYFI
jgi:hypothetical protein